MVIEKDKVVSLHYVMKNEQGEVLQDNYGYMPELYLHGHGQILPGLEHVLEGVRAGEEIEVSIPPDDAFGPKELSLVFEVSFDDLEDPDSISTGDPIQLFDGTEVVVLEKLDDCLLVDANHPLAGQTLYYTLKVTEIREATEEELREGVPVRVDKGSCSSPNCNC